MLFVSASNELLVGLPSSCSPMLGSCIVENCVSCVNVRFTEMSAECGKQAAAAPSAACSMQVHTACCTHVRTWLAELLRKRI